MRKPFYLYKRERSKYYYCQFRNPRTGELEPEVSTGETNKTNAEAWAKEQAEELHGSTTLFGDYAAPFFGPDCPRCTRKQIEGHPYSPGTIKEYKYNLDRLILSDKILCAKPIGKITRGDIIELRARWLKKIGHTVSLQKPLDALKAVFAEAEYMEYLEYNPASKVRDVVYEKKTIYIPNAEEILELVNPENFKPVEEFKKSNHYRDDGFRFGTATALYAFTGMRAAEIRALQWGDVDMENRRIRVVRAFKAKAHILGPPKNGYARTTVIPDILAPYLSNPGDPLMWVTGLSEKRPMGYKKWHDVFQDVCKEKGIQTTLHALRHALNTMLLEKGVNPELIKAVFGWTDKGENRTGKKFGKDIQETYTHRDKYDLAPLLKAIDEIFTAEKEKAKQAQKPNKVEK
jgi:integrase